MGKPKQQKAELKNDTQAGDSRDSRDARQWTGRQQLRKLETQELYTIARDAADWLYERALTEDKAAARNVLHLASRCVGQVEHLSECEEDELRNLVRSVSRWPVAFPARKGDQLALSEKLASRGFATECETNELGKLNLGAPMTKAVQGVFFFLVRHLRDNKGAGSPLITTAYKSSDIRGNYAMFVHAKERCSQPITFPA